MSGKLAATDKYLKDRDRKKLDIDQSERDR